MPIKVQLRLKNKPKLKNGAVQVYKHSFTGRVTSDRGEHLGFSFPNAETIKKNGIEVVSTLFLITFHKTDYFYFFKTNAPVVIELSTKYIDIHLKFVGSSVQRKTRRA